MKALLLLLSLPMCLLAQKRIENTFDAKGIKTLHIHSDAIFKIAITTEALDKITIKTIIEGETYESSVVKTVIVGERLEISTGRLPDFIPFNDKLSAHKVLSIELVISIPKDIDIDIRSVLAEVSLQGDCGSIAINLGRGGFIGNALRFRESAINTISGNITLALYEEARITYRSRNGMVAVPTNFNNGPLCQIQSIHGDIEVLQVK